MHPLIGQRASHRSKFQQDLSIAERPRREDLIQIREYLRHHQGKLRPSLEVTHQGKQ